MAHIEHMGLFDYIRGVFGGGSDESPVGPAGHQNESTGAGGSGNGVDQMIANARDREDSETVASEMGEDIETGVDGGNGDKIGTGPDEADHQMPSPESFQGAAEELAVMGDQHHLDFTPESLPRLDELVTAEWETERVRGHNADGVGARMDELSREELEVLLGSYFGETLVRTHENATWQITDEYGWVVSVDGPDGKLLSNVFTIAENRLVESTPLAASYDDVMRHSGVGDPILADRGDDHTRHIGMPDKGVDPTEFRAIADRFVERYAGYDLDYSPASLAALDQLVTAEREEEAQTIDTAVEYDRADTVEGMGSYFGETLLANHSGAWVHEGGTWTVDVEVASDVTGVEAFHAAVSALNGDLTFVGIYQRLLGAPGEGDEDRGETVGELAAAQAGELARLYDSYDLDYSPGSLERLDRLVEEEFGEFADIDEPTDQLLAAAAPFSAYFGEVLRREHGAVWTARDGPAIFLETAAGDAVGLDALQAAATCLAGNATFVRTYNVLLAER